MCLYVQTQYPKARTAKRSITVYKVLFPQGETAAVSPFQYYHYTVGGLHSIPAARWAEQKRETRLSGAVHNGFHSFSTLEKARDDVRGWNRDERRCAIYKCSIPKGAQYFLGQGNERCSNRIVIVERV